MLTVVAFGSGTASSFRPARINYENLYTHERVFRLLFIAVYYAREYISVRPIGRLCPQNFAKWQKVRRCFLPPEGEETHFADGPLPPRQFPPPGGGGNSTMLFRFTRVRDLTHRRRFLGFVTPSAFLSKIFSNSRAKKT